MSIFKDILSKLTSEAKEVKIDVDPESIDKDVKTDNGLDAKNKAAEEKFKSEIWAYLKSNGWQETDHETYSKVVYIPSGVIVNGMTFEAPYVVEINDIGAFYHEINDQWVYLGESLEITIDDIYSSPTELISSIDELKDIVKDIHNRNFC